MPRASRVSRGFRAAGGRAAARVPAGSKVIRSVAAVQAAVEVARRSWALDGIAVEFAAADTGPAMLAGRAGMLEQAMLHLLENARDAVLERRRVAPGAPGRITVSIPPPAAGHLTVLVRDSGCGVPPALGDRILDPFVTTKEPGHGSGLGLPIAKNLIDLHGGTFTLKSKLLIGTEVIVTFPPERVMSALAPLSDDSPPLQPESSLVPE